jgi:hypothetical protein
MMKIEMDNVAAHLDQVIKYIHQVEEKFDPDLTSVQNASITNNLGYLVQMKTLGLEVQYSIGEWYIFT